MPDPASVVPRAAASDRLHPRRSDARAGAARWWRRGPLLTIALSSLIAGCATLDGEDELEDETGVEVSELRGGDCDDDCRGRHGNRRRVRIAWMDSDPSNTYDAANGAGVTEVADANNGRVTPFYSFFDPALQLEQCLDIVHSRRYDAIVIIPVDAVGIIECVEAARRRGIPVVASDLPIGPDITTVEPQVRGQAGAVLVPPSDWGDQLIPLVTDLCASHAPCNVVYIAGSLDVANDQVAVARLTEASEANPALQLVAAEQAFYDPGLAYSITESILAGGTEIHVLIAGGDQMAQGAEGAIAAAGASGSIRIVGAGAGGYGIQAVREGRWYATFLALPYDEGVLAADLAIRAAQCRPIHDRGINPVERLGLPAFFTTDNQDELEGFEAQWPG